MHKHRPWHDAHPSVSFTLKIIVTSLSFTVHNFTSLSFAAAPSTGARGARDRFATSVPHATSLLLHAARSPPRGPSSAPSSILRGAGPPSASAARSAKRASVRVSRAHGHASSRRAHLGTRSFLTSPAPSLAAGAPAFRQNCVNNGTVQRVSSSLGRANGRTGCHVHTHASMHVHRCMCTEPVRAPPTRSTRTCSPTAPSGSAEGSVHLLETRGRRARQ